MKKIILTILALLWMCGSAFAGEFWIDSNLETNGTGTESSPFNSMDTPESVITPGAVHTFHLKGSDIPYSGGFGGHNLKRWLFGKCTIIKDESNGKTVKFSPARSVPFSQFSDGPVAGTKVLYINPNFPMRKYRFYVDMDNSRMVLTRAIYLGPDANIGFKWDRDNHKLTVTPAIIKQKFAHDVRVAKIRAMKAYYKENGSMTGFEWEE